MEDLRTAPEERHERLNALARVIYASKYLEIGVAEGVTFLRVDVPYKVAVDPRFKLDTRAHAGPGTVFHEVTSDLFFSDLAAAHSSFDLIFLDGLHTFEQTFRDFRSSLKYSNTKTVWLIDDTDPTGALAACPSLTFTVWARRIFRIKDLDWMGDVFKVVFAIHDLFPELSYATFPGHGQTAVWREPRPDFEPTWGSVAEIARLGYRDFLRFRESHLSIQETPEILERVRQSRVTAP